jgi:hypothetical protein
MSSQVRHMHAVYSRAEEVCIYWGECADLTTQCDFYHMEHEEDLHPFWRNEAEKYLNPVWRDEAALWPDIKQEAWRDEAEVWPDIKPEAPRNTREGPNSLSNTIASRSTEYRLPQSPLEGCTPDVHRSGAYLFVVALENELLRDNGEDDSLHHFWWKRLWTVQELLLAKHPVVYCGPYVILWKTVCRIWTEIDTHYDLILSSKLTDVRMRLDIAHLNALRSRSERNLHDLLLATTDKAFTEPKDRVFALLGALSQDTFSPNYALDLRVIYTSTAVHCVSTQCAFDILFSQWERGYPLGTEAQGLYSCVPDFDRSRSMPTMTWQTSCLLRPEQGRWERGRSSTLPGTFSFEYACPERIETMSVLSGRNTSVELIENTASRCRIAFNGAFASTVSKLYNFGQHDLDWILTDLSRTASQYFAGSLCEGNEHWNVSITNRQEQHAYDLYKLLLESCFLNLDGNA